jgi:hypothetical protein
LNTLTEETVPLPFADNRQLTFMVHFQEKFYVLGGEAIDEDYNINDVADHWMLDETTDTWSELDSGPVFDHFSNRNNGFWSGFLHNGALYMYFDNTTHRLNPDMSLETLGGEIYMVYKNTLISPNNYRGGFRDYEADYLVPGVEHNLGFAYELRHFFVLGEEVYFKKDEATYKLKKEILNEIL